MRACNVSTMHALPDWLMLSDLESKTLLLVRLSRSLMVDYESQAGKVRSIYGLHI